MCPIHQHSFEEWCPHCKRGSQVLTAKARPGYCYRCRSWLGTPVRHGERVEAGSYDAELSVANAVGGLLALAPALPQAPSGIYLKDNLRRCIDDFAGGNHSHFARLTGVSLDSIYRWLSTSSCIPLDAFVRMCCKLRLPAARFLSEYIPVNDPGWEHARDQAQRTSSPGPRRRPPHYRGSVPESAMNAGASIPLPTQNSIRNGLERVVCKPLPQAFQAVAKDLGFNNSSSLYKRFPDLCRAQVMKNLRWRQQEDERIRDAITKALEESPPPSMRELATRLGHTATALRARFPELSAALAARIPERRLCEKNRMRGRLQSALELNMAPPMKDVARALGRNAHHLQTLFPSLCQQIKDRYIQQKKRVSSEKKLRFCEEIRHAVADLCEGGINPSRKHVMAAIVNPSMRSSHILDRQIVQTLHELETASRTSSASCVSG